MQHDNDVVMVAGTRTAIGKFGGALKDVNSLVPKLQLGNTTVQKLQLRFP
ncbi:MAG: hypothetical protein SWC40_10685 [Thermodesulfobacteriota bacterium]|nr:hypothetical protein [Thermodesulfobacteriota bacterium]